MAVLAHGPIPVSSINVVTGSLLSVVGNLAEQRAPTWSALTWRLHDWQEIQALSQALLTAG